MRAFRFGLQSFNAENLFATLYENRKLGLWTHT